MNDSVKRTGKETDRKKRLNGSQSDNNIECDKQLNQKVGGHTHKKDEIFVVKRHFIFGCCLLDSFPSVRTHQYCYAIRHCNNLWRQKKKRFFFFVAAVAAHVMAVVLSTICTMTYIVYS